MYSGPRDAGAEEKASFAKLCIGVPGKVDNVSVPVLDTAQDSSQHKLGT